MRSNFCKFQQRRFWHEIREHLSALPGVAVMVAVDDPVIGSWIDFTFRGRSFTINSEAGEFMIFTEDAGCPEAVRAEIRAHFETFSDSGDGGDISLRRV
jgi:hypothetical protein